MIRVFGHASALRQQAIALTAICFAFGGLAFAQEMSTDAERTHAQVRSAKDAKTRYLAERWYNLVRLQEWKSLDGKFTTTAKYVEHDPNLAWVKLRTVKGTGANRVVKDVTIPIDKLSKTCQSRVRQIANLTDKVKAAAVEATTAKEEDEAEREDASPAVRENEEIVEEESVDDEPPRLRRERGRRRPPRDREEGEQSALPPRSRRESGATNSKPLPGRLPPLPTAAPGTPLAPQSDVAVASAETPRADDASPPPLDPEHPVMPDQDPWRTDYEKFRTVFERDEDGIISTAERWWGVIELQSAIPQEFMVQDPHDDSPKPFVESRRAQEIGDFIWEGTVATQPTSSDPNWADVFGLAPLPEPLKLELRVSNPGQAATWQTLQPGDRVKFIGRFTGYKGAYTWVAEIMAVGAQVDDAAPADDSAAEETTRTE